jgi:hypothetical protein
VTPYAAHRALYITTCQSCAAEYADPLTVWPADPPKERRPMPLELVILAAVALAVVAVLLWSDRRAPR